MGLILNGAKIPPFLRHYIEASKGRASLGEVTETFQGKRKAVAHFNGMLWELMSPRDREAVKSIIVNTMYRESGVKGRTITYRLKDPVPAEDPIVFAVRLKGTVPKVSAEGIVPPHTGAGFRPEVPVVDAEGVIRNVDSPFHGPEGGEAEKFAKKEFDATLVTGPELADIAFCHGTFPELSFQGLTLGFSGYALQGTADIRYGNGVLDPWKRMGRGSREEVCRLGGLLGEVLAGFHGYGVEGGRFGAAHYATHLDNFGVVDCGGEGPLQIRIRDLLTRKPLEPFSPKERYGYLFLDFAMAVVDFCFEDQGGELFIDYEQILVAQAWFNRYFKETVPLDFRRRGMIYSPAFWDKLSDSEKAIYSIKNLMDDVKRGAAFNLIDRLRGLHLPFIDFMDQRLSVFAGV